MNITAGRYFAPNNVPFDIGFEGIVQIESLGDDVKSKAAELGLKEGSPAIFLGGKSYTEYIYLSGEELAKSLFPIPEPNPDYLTFIVSGLTSTIGLDLVSCLN